MDNEEIYLSYPKRKRWRAFRVSLGAASLATIGLAAVVAVESRSDGASPNLDAGAPENAPSRFLSPLEAFANGYETVQEATARVASLTAKCMRARGWSQYVEAEPGIDTQMPFDLSEARGWAKKDIRPSEPLAPGPRGPNETWVETLSRGDQDRYFDDLNHGADEGKAADASMSGCQPSSEYAIAQSHPGSNPKYAGAVDAQRRAIDADPALQAATTGWSKCMSEKAAVNVPTPRQLIIGDETSARVRSANIDCWSEHLIRVRQPLELAAVAKIVQQFPELAASVKE
jgi:hypothetical protein